MSLLYRTTKPVCLLWVTTLTWLTIMQTCESLVWLVLVAFCILHCKWRSGLSLLLVIGNRHFLSHRVDWLACVAGGPLLESTQSSIGISVPRYQIASCPKPQFPSFSKLWLISSPMGNMPSSKLARGEPFKPCPLTRRNQPSGSLGLAVAVSSFCGISFQFLPVRSGGISLSLDRAY
jgi:hypothetical protein